GVLRAMRLVLVEHMDDVLREALDLESPESLFGPRPDNVLEYVDARLRNPGHPDDGEEPPDHSAPVEPAAPAEQPAVCAEASVNLRGAPGAAQGAVRRARRMGPSHGPVAWACRMGLSHGAVTWASSHGPPVPIS